LRDERAIFNLKRKNNYYNNNRRQRGGGKQFQLRINNNYLKIYRKNYSENSYL